MRTTKHTLSLCPSCYREITARIVVDSNGAMMHKKCPEHGNFASLVERDPLFYLYAAGLKAKTIYGGHLVDITRTCQLRCDPCYFRLEKHDPAGMFTVESIVNECAVNIHRAPFILTGGEPTLHPQLLQVIKEVSQVGPVELLSNGIKLADPEFFNDVMPLITDASGVSHLNLSIHPETAKWAEVVALAKKEQVRIESVMIVVSSRNEFVNALELCKTMAGVVQTFRIKAASNLWNASLKTERIFVSDMLQWLEEEQYNVVYVAAEHNKPCFFNVLANGMHLMLVSWYDVSNVDLIEIDCPPTYRARNGQVANFVTAALINEGIDKANSRAERIHIATKPEEVLA